jgi:type IX secretion system PorP/SprF family membrane protein
MKRIVTLIIILLPIILFGQDIHFSQYYFSPVNLNPANTGNFEGEYRLNANQRTQWKSVTTPYSTFALAADANNFLSKKNVGVSLGIMNDVAGDSKLNTLQFTIGGSYKINLKNDSSQTITVGIQTGYTQKKINFNNLSFDNQFDGFLYNPQLSINENFTTNKKSYANANIGAVYKKEISYRKNIQVGISLHNVNKPQQSFNSDKNVRLDNRVTLYTSAEIYLKEKWDLLPSFLFMDQGAHTEIILGAMAKHILNNNTPFNRAIYAGYYGRVKDAGYILGAIDYDAWKVGLSYDINFSKLENASRNRGGFEISVIYILQNLKNKIALHKLCPNFI